MIEWHRKLEEVRLLEMRQSRELNTQREEIKYLKNIMAEQERTISGQEEELVQQNNVSIAFKQVSSLFLHCIKHTSIMISNNICSTCISFSRSGN